MDLGIASDVCIAEKGNAHWPVLGLLLCLGVYVFLHVLHGPAPLIVGSHGQEREMPAEHGVARDPLLGLMARFESKIAGRIQKVTGAVKGMADGAAKGNDLCLHLGAMLQPKEQLVLHKK